MLTDKQTEDYEHLYNSQ